MRCHVLGTHHDDGWVSFTVDMRNVPREGEMMIINGSKPYLIKRVTWVINADESSASGMVVESHNGSFSKPSACADLVSIYVEPYKEAAPAHEVSNIDEAARNDVARDERQRIITHLKRAAEGRLEYASRTGNDHEAAALLTQAAQGLTDAVSFIENPSLILDAIPSWRWTSEERSRLYATGTDAKEPW